MKIRFLVLLFITLLVLTGLAIQPSITHVHASGTASCSGSSCAGLDPRRTGCSADATNAHTETFDYRDSLGFTVTLDLRYSGTCKAWWVRAIVSPASAVTSVGVYNLAAPSSQDRTKDDYWLSRTVIGPTMQAYGNMSSTQPARGSSGAGAQAYAVVWTPPGVTQDGLLPIYFDN